MALQESAVKEALALKEQLELKFKESEALKEQLALKESAVKEALALNEQLALKESAEQLALMESGALKEQMTLKESAVKEALALTDNLVKEVENLKQQLVLKDRTTREAEVAVPPPPSTSPPPPQKESQQLLASGLRVRIDGLTKAVQYNGLDATIIELLSDGRVSVVLDHFNGKEIKVKPENLLVKEEKMGQEETDPLEDSVVKEKVKGWFS